ncbi:MAG: HlyD family efflux transporter periplasmic adaptor subunit [Deltaproteobacteria bacterium]|nr:HlyD family efflux transporter periplasmic adaptor subunit [Deltaproteobacteria bacterium]
MKTKHLISVLVLGIIVSAAIYFALQLTKHDNGKIRVSGNIEVTSVELSFKIPGRVTERPVDEGEPVKKGDVVARLDPADLLHEAASRRAETQAARALLTELETGYRKEEIAQAEAVLRRIEAEAKRLRIDFGRQEQLFKKEVISARDFDVSRAAYESSQANVREAQERLKLLQSGPRKETIDQARARLQSAESVLALAETRLGYATLVSPVNGLVLSKNIEPGEQVAVGTPVITVGLLEEVWLRAYISETDLGRVQLGQKATVTTDSFPGKKYQGTISFISPEAEFTPKSVQTEKERVKLVYRIKITIPNRHGELKPGMPADAEIE